MVAEKTCQYRTDQKTCGAHATEIHKDTYYKADFPVCAEHKAALEAVSHGV